MLLIAAVAVNGDGGGDKGRGRGGSGSDNGNNRNGRNGEGSGRNGANWEVEQIKGMDSEGTMLAMVELRTGVTAEDI
jgi:hypothetical protein